MTFEQKLQKKIESEAKKELDGTTVSLRKVRIDSANLLAPLLVEIQAELDEYKYKEGMDAYEYAQDCAYLINEILDRLEQFVEGES